MAKFSESMDPFFLGRNAAVLQYTQFTYVDESTRRRLSNAGTPKPSRFEQKWAKLFLAKTAMRGKADLQEAALIVTTVRLELTKIGTLLIRTALAPFGCGEFVIKHGEYEDRSAGKLVVPKLQVKTTNDEQGPSESKKNEERGGEGEEHRQPKKPKEQDPDQAERHDGKASVVGASSLDFIFAVEGEEGTETLAGTTETAGDELSMLEPPSAFVNASITCRRAAPLARLKPLRRNF